MEIKPLYPYVLVKPIPEEKPEGIIVPDTSIKQPSRGIVVSTAEGISEVSKGQGVCWKELQGTYIDDLILVDLNDILYVYDIPKEQ